MSSPASSTWAGARLRRARTSGPLVLVPPGDAPPLPLPLGSLTIGHSRVCDIVVRAARVFARHATLLVEPTSATVETLLATAEIRVNDMPVRRATLTPGDVLSIGAASFRLEAQRSAPEAVDLERRADAPPWIDALERLHEWSRSGPLDRRGAMLGLLVERLGLAGAAIVTLGATGGIQVLSAWGEVVDLLRGSWVRDRLAAATRSWSPGFEVRAGDALAVVTGPGAAPVGLLARRVEGAWHPAILRLAARLFAHEHARVHGTEPLEREPADLAFPAGMMIGRAASMQRLYAEIRVVAEGAMPVVLVGETGVGKGVVARLLHDSSPRRHLPLRELDCSAPEDAFVAELAQLRPRGGRPSKGAMPGTLLLDEVGRLGPGAQGALMATLNELARNEPAASAPRVIASTHLDPQAALARSQIRSDLWYRLAGAVIAVPALRDRMEDLPLLFDHFLLAAAGPRRPSVSPEALHLLLAHDWPGNLRELRWEAQRAAARAAGTAAIGPEQLSPALHATTAGPVESDLRLADHLERVERRLLLEALHTTRGNLSRAARLLGITRPRIRRRMAALSVEWPPAAGESARARQHAASTRSLRGHHRGSAGGDRGHATPLL